VPSSRPDVLIRSAQVVDGTGNPWYYGDVLLKGGRILAIEPAGSVSAESADDMVDALGLVVAPGFIDIQSHSVLPLMVDGRSLSKVTQGVTTEIMGESRTPAPTGGLETVDTLTWHEFQSADIPGLKEWLARSKSWSRFRDWLDALIVSGVTPNVGSYLGGGTLRLLIKGLDASPATPTELDAMRAIVRDAMIGGAFGVSYALIYPPDSFAPKDEIVEICKVVAEFGGGYITHLRSESDRLLEAVDEALEISARSKTPVEIYHLKAAGAQNWWKMARVIEKITAARNCGIDVTANMYPYIAGCTALASILPPWAAEDGLFFERIQDTRIRELLRAEVKQPDGSWEAIGTRAGADGIFPLVLEKPENKRYIGRSLADIARDLGRDWIDAALDLLAGEGQTIASAYFLMSEDNLAQQIRQPWMKISTDAPGIDPAWAAENGQTHPRTYGTYPRVLAKYVRDEGVLSLEDAVRKMSGAVAQRLGLRDRGFLFPGYFADIVVFDANSVADKATFTDCHRLSSGVKHVWINGSRVVQDGAHTGATPGRIVNGPGYSEDAMR